MECASPASAPTPSDSVEQAALPPPGDCEPPPGNASLQPHNELQGEGISGLKEAEDGSSASGAAPNGCSVVELQQRASVMFTSGKGFVEISGEPLIAGGTTNAVLLFASLAIHTLFEQRRADVERGCGSLNKEIALGFLVADTLNRRISGEEAREAGKRAGKQIATVKTKIDKLKERAKGKRSAARKAAGKDSALALTLVVRIAEIDTELTAARDLLLKQPYDLGLPDEDIEMNESETCDASPESPDAQC